jgi:putative ABC transport system permease protein
VNQLPSAAAFTVGQGYFESLGITLIRGRSFSNQDRRDSLLVAVINNEMAREYFAGQDPLGKQIRPRSGDDKTPAGPWLTIVGIVGDTRSVRYNQIRWDRYPAIYTPFTQRPETPGKVRNSSALTLYLYFQTEMPVNATAISSAAHELDPNLPVNKIRSTGEIVSGLRSQPRTRAALLGSFAVLTLLLAAIGVYGVMTQLTELRRRDIGIRIALGACPSDIRALIFRRAIALTLPGLAIGVLGAVGASRLLSSFLYGISALNPAIFAGVVVMLCSISLVASYNPARRAGRVDPITVLRSE